VKHARKTEDVISVHVADEYPHFSIRASFRLQELSLSTFTAVEEQQLRTTAQEDAWQSTVLTWNTATRSKKSHCDGQCVPSPKVSSLQ
jgi:hypothetical protein